MKKVIDTVEEIIKKDASTQTEPVIIIENEKNIAKEEDQQLSDLKLKRDEYAVEIRKAKRGEEFSKIRNKKLLLGQDNVEEQARFEEELEAEQQIKSDAGFYDKCKSYVAQVYPEEIDSSDLYSGIAGSLKWPIVDQVPGFNMEEFINLIKNMFRKVTYTDGYDFTHEEIRDDLALRAAGIYAVCTDRQAIKDFLEQRQAINFTDPSSLRWTIQGYLAEVTSQELAGEVFDILDNTN